MKNEKILFLTLHSFSLTGGIEKVCRCVSKILSDLNDTTKSNHQLLSLYDDQPDLKYIEAAHFKGFKGNRLAFLSTAIKTGLSANIIILSHVNLLLFAWILNKIHPKKRIILLAHGIEIWGTLPKWKTIFLRKNTEIWAVSHYTAQQIEKTHHLLPSKIKTLNNSLDPLFSIPTHFTKPETLLHRYQISSSTKILFTLTRLSSQEQYKGYDQVILALKNLPEEVIYILAGKADEKEKIRVLNLIAQHHLNHRVILTGFLADDDVQHYFLLADLFVMPSKGEGFGIAFIEAAACGLASIAGNADGSRDALLNGKLGDFVDPDNIEEITSTITKHLALPKDQANVLHHQSLCLNAFGFEQYKTNFLNLLSN
ncbi:glycosyltransferase family 4 protein [Pedobacter sp. N23S346]|uniref:glycosyltransferase family 4 protein n=1 Tax=Pedobacter sp. N23S346 TaxID=3402750 RepID=UPI003AD59F69